MTRYDPYAEALRAIGAAANVYRIATAQRAEADTDMVAAVAVYDGSPKSQGRLASAMEWQNEAVSSEQAAWAEVERLRRWADAIKVIAETPRHRRVDTFGVK